MHNVADSLRTGGLFFVEMRSTKDELYGKGEEVAINAFVYNGHFRRFIDRQVFLEKLEKFNFETVYAEEKNGFSKTKESNPTLIRIIAKKR